MPRFPHFAARTSRLTGSVYEIYRGRMAAQGDRLVALHIGDSYAPPPYPLPLDAAFTRANPSFNRYCDTFGVPALREALVAKLREDNALDVTRDNVLVTNGATNALSATMQTLVDPGDEVIILAPYWPFFRGMVRAAGGEIREVPVYTTNADAPAMRARLDAALTPRTVAVYLNTPNNPSGRVLSRAHVETVAAFARDNNLWLLSDEAYDGMAFDGREPLSPASLPGMLERSVSVFTFSKVYLFAGLRLGYAVASPDVIQAVNRAMVHQLYSPSSMAQQMMVEPVRTRRTWRSTFVDEYQRTRDAVAKVQRFDAPLPEGAYFFFFPVDAYLRGRSVSDVVNACLDAGVSVAPGADFGADYATWLRICFAGESPERVLTGVERLNGVLAG